MKRKAKGIKRKNNCRAQGKDSKMSSKKKVFRPSYGAYAAMAARTEKLLFEQMNVQPEKRDMQLINEYIETLEYLHSCMASYIEFARKDRTRAKNRAVRYALASSLCIGTVALAAFIAVNPAADRKAPLPVAAHTCSSVMRHYPGVVFTRNHGNISKEDKEQPHSESGGTEKSRVELR